MRQQTVPEVATGYRKRTVADSGNPCISDAPAARMMMT